MDQYRAFLVCATLQLQASSSTDPNGWPMGQNGPQTNRSPKTLLDQGDTSLCDTVHSHLIPLHVWHPLINMILIIIGYQVTENRERQRSREHLSCMRLALTDPESGSVVSKRSS